MAKKEKTKIEPPKDNLQTILSFFVLVFIGLALVSLQSLIGEGLQSSILQSEMDDKQDYNTHWGNIHQIQKNLNTDAFIDIEDSDEPQTDKYFPPLKEVFYDAVSHKKIAQQDSNYELDDSFKYAASAWTFSRPGDIYVGDYKIFDNVNPNDINQGQMGDCQFLVVLSSLAETPSRIKKIFNQQHKRPSGIQSLNMQVDGIKQKVQIDDQLATQNGFLVFAHNKQNKLWVSLIEKAWAKFHLTYNNTQGGLPSIAYKKITGFPGQYFFNPSNFDWNVILKAESKNWPMWCGSVTNDALQHGLIGGHAYSLLAGKEVTLDNGNTIKLLKIRNPWGQGEWTGDWSDTSGLWTDKIKAELGITHSFKTDGAFWMDWSDFKKYFQLMSFGYQIDDAEQQQYRMKKTGRQQFIVETNKAQDFIATNTFTSNRLLRMQTNTISAPIYSMWLIDYTTHNHIEEKGAADQNNQIQVESLPAGKYILIVDFKFSKGTADLSKIRSVVGVWGTDQSFKYQQYDG